MFYRHIYKNSILPFVLLPFFMLALWAKILFWNNVPYSPSELSMPLYEAIESLWGNHRLIGSLVSLFAAFLVMFGLNRFNSNYNLLKRQTIAPGYIYLIFVSGYISVQQMHPVWLFAPLMIMAIDKTFAATALKEHSLNLFNAAFLVSVGVLFYAKALFFFPLIWWIMALLNIFSFRGFLATLLGLVSPLLVTMGIYFVLGNHYEVIQAAHENLLTPVAFYDHSMISKVYNGYLVLLIVMAIVVVVSKINNMKILTRKLYRVLIAVVSFGIVMAATPFFSMEIIPVIGIGASLILAQLFDALKKSFWQEMFFAIFVLFTLIMQWHNA